MAVGLNKVLTVFLIYILFAIITTAVADQGKISSLSNCLKKSHKDSKKMNALSTQIVKAKSWEKIKKIMSVKNTKQFSRHQQQLLTCVDLFAKAGKKQYATFNFEAYKKMVSAYIDIYSVALAPTSGQCHFHYLDGRQFNSGACHYRGKLRVKLQKFLVQRSHSMILNSARATNQIKY